MKVFLIIWTVICLLVVAGLVVAYATDLLPRVKVSSFPLGVVEADCSPCEENVKRLKEALRRAESGHRVSPTTEHGEQLKTATEELIKAFEKNDNERSAADIKQKYELLTNLLVERLDEK